MDYRPDQIDKSIIALLQEDGRMDCTEIARRLKERPVQGRVSARMVRYRINRMVGAGTIKIAAIVDPDTNGLPVKADVWIQVEVGKAMEVAKCLAEFPQVIYVACSTGDMDISMQVCARNNQELYHLVASEISRVEGIKKTVTQLIPVIIKDIYAWNLPDSVCQNGE